MNYALDAEIETLLEQTIHGSSINALLLCPVHDEDNPSFSIHRETGLWYCFSCGAKGNMAQLYYRLGENEPEDRKLERLYRLATSDQGLPDKVNNFAPLANHYIAMADTRAGRRAISDFCATRPINPSTCERFGVGYNPEKNAIAFPYYEADGRVALIRYRGRSGLKWSQDDGRRILYGIPEAIGRGTVVIAEGESDTLALAGRLPDGIGICGSPGANVSPATWRIWGLDLLFGQRIILAYDSDKAGTKGADVAMQVLGSERCERVIPTRGNDICEHLQNGGTLGEMGLSF